MFDAAEQGRIYSPSTTRGRKRNPYETRPKSQWNNFDKILSAVNGGHDTLEKISVETYLSEVTCLRVLQALSDDRRIVRSISRDDFRVHYTPQGRKYYRKKSTDKPKIEKGAGPSSAKNRGDYGTPEIQRMRRELWGHPHARGELCCPFDLLAPQIGEELLWAAHSAKVIYARYAKSILPRALWAHPWWDQLSYTDPKDAKETYFRMRDRVSKDSRAWRELERAIYAQMPKNVENLRRALVAVASLYDLYYWKETKGWRAA